MLFRPKIHRAGLIRGLPRIGVKRSMGQFIGDFIVHGNKDIAWFFVFEWFFQFKQDII